MNHDDSLFDRLRRLHSDADWASTSRELSARGEEAIATAARALDAAPQAVQTRIVDVIAEIAARYEREGRALSFAAAEPAVAPLVRLLWMEHPGLSSKAARA